MNRLNVIDFKNRDDWLHGRVDGIGGSDASAIIGCNPYKTNQDLFDEKTGRLIPEDISQKDYVKYGTIAEEHIREIFRLDYPTMKVAHYDWRILQRSDRPWMQASLDGELIDPEGRRGILEIKTTNILQSMQREKWNDQIPQNYYAQILWYLMVTGWEFVILRADLRSEWSGYMRHQIRDYRIDREEVEGDLEYIEEEAIKFWRYVEEGRRPPLVLPMI